MAMGAGRVPLTPCKAQGAMVSPRDTALMSVRTLITYHKVIHDALKLSFLFMTPVGTLLAAEKWVDHLKC